MPTISKKVYNAIALAIGIALTIWMLFTIHSLAKLPDEPFWASPMAIYENWQFALILGLGLPYIGITAPLMLLLALYINYAIGKLLIRLLLRLFGSSSPA